MISTTLALLLVTALQGTPDRQDMFQRYFTYWQHVKGGSISAHWMEDGNCFWFAEGAPADTVIYKVDPVAKTKAPLFDAQRLRKAFADAAAHEPPYKGLPFSTFTFQPGEKSVRFEVGSQAYTMDLASYAVTPEQALWKPSAERSKARKVGKSYVTGVGEETEVASPDGRWFAFSKDHNLWLRSSQDDQETQVTTDGTEDFEWATGVLWSPDSSKLVCFKLDNRGVSRMPIVHWLGDEEKVEWLSFPRAGGKLTQFTVCVLDVLSKQLMRLRIGQSKDAYILPLHWRTDGSEVILARVGRCQKRVDLLAANPSDGSTRVILTEEQKTNVGGLDLYTDLYTGFVPLTDNKRFIWASERDGWNHLYLYGFDGKLIRRLTKGEFPVLKCEGVDEKGGWVYLTAHGEKRLYDTHLYRVKLDGGSQERLTEPGQTHEIELSPSKRFFVDRHSTVALPPAIEVRGTDGKPLLTVSKADTTELKAKLKWQPPEEFVVKAADVKTDLYGVLYKPYDFDPSKRYPVIDSIYGGPQICWAPRSFLDPLNYIPQSYAQLGYIVFVVDARGTPERGKAFQDVVCGNFGRDEIPDHVAALKALAKERPYMDLSRVGIYGGSWGGYMTLRAMLTAPEVYKAGVAQSPVTDLYDHPASAIEPYMGLPQENKAGYDFASDLALAGKLQGKLLLIHGTNDANAPFSATMKMVEALTRAGKPYSLIVLPEETHGPNGPSGKYMYEAIGRFFGDALKP